MNNMKRRTVTYILVGVIVVLLASVVVLFWKYQQTKNPGDEARKTSARIIQKVSDLYLLPKDEEPTVAQIQDKSKLGNQQFFKSSENGDYLLIYQKSKVALVYREKANKLVTVGPISIGDQTGNTSGQNQSANTNSDATTQ